MPIPINAAIEVSEGRYRSVSSQLMLLQTDTPSHVVVMANEAHALLDPTAHEMNPYEISAQTLGGRKTKLLSEELFARMRENIEDVFGVDTSEWNNPIGVLKCRSAAYHRDAYSPDVAYLNWYIDGPEAIFCLDQQQHAIEPGSLFLFDPYCPHALIYPGQTLEPTHTEDHTPSSLFVTMEVPLASVAHLIHIKAVQNPELIMAPQDSIHPVSGEWCPA